MNLLKYHSVFFGIKPERYDQRNARKWNARKPSQACSINWERAMECALSGERAGAAQCFCFFLLTICLKISFPVVQYQQIAVCVDLFHMPTILSCCLEL